MTIADIVAAGAKLAVVPGESGPVLRGSGSLATVGQVPVVPWSGGTDRAMRMTSGHVVVSGAPSFTGGSFTVEAWVRVPRAATSRTVFRRANGSTQVTVTVGADGVPQAVVSSAAGPYTVTLRGGARVDDAQFHQVAVVAEHGWFGAVEFVLVVDGRAVRSGQMRPGLFSAWPDLSMTTPVYVGGVGGSALLSGDMAAVGCFSSALSLSTLSSRWLRRPAPRRAGTGWGIVVG